jgi:hypothetical protein
VDLQAGCKGRTDLARRILTIPGAAHSFISPQGTSWAISPDTVGASALPDNCQWCLFGDFDGDVLRNNMKLVCSVRIEDGVVGGMDAFVRIIEEIFEEGI